jgi:hypothetical protein
MAVKRQFLTATQGRDVAGLYFRNVDETRLFVSSLFFSLSGGLGAIFGWNGRNHVSKV